MEPQCVRDLRWVVETPSLIDGDNVVAPSTFNVGDIDPDELHRFLADRAGHRVGRYFENLILFWLTRIRQIDLVAHGHQIQDGTKTVGEIDFLFRDEAGRLNHCEAAVKFFLHHPHDGTSDYPGPNARDNFEKKVAKLFDKQLRVSEEYFPDVEVREAFVRGLIFYHPSIGEPETGPDRLSCSHLRGIWVRSSELQLLQKFDNCRGSILNKPLWLSHPDSSECVSWSVLVDELTEHFAGSDFPVMVSLMDAPASEVCRAFVVSDSWPLNGRG